MPIKSKFLLFTTEHNGFGPVSKMCNIALMFKSQRKYFVGRGIALEYVRNMDNNLFEKIIDSSKLNKKQLGALIKKSKFVINVMEQDMAFLSYEKKVKYYFFDSLFGFWYSRKNDLNLFKKFRALSKDKKISRVEYDKFSIHEKKMLAHVLSEGSFIQNFFGVTERYLKLKKYLPKSFLVKPFAYDYVSADKLVKKQNIEKGLMTINLGGIKNFIVNNNQSAYFDLIFKISKKLLCEKKINIRKIVVCSGLYGAHGVIYRKLNKKIIHTFLNNRPFLRLIEKSELCLSSAGLTSIFEFLCLRKPVIYLPEQHSSQYYNLKQIRKTLIGRFSISINDIFIKTNIPQNDYTGSRRIMDYIKIINSEKKYFDKLYSCILERVAKYKERGREIDFESIHASLSENTISLKDTIEIIKQKNYD